MLSYTYTVYIQFAAERTPRFGRVIASGGDRVPWWGARRRTAVYMPFAVYTWRGFEKIEPLLLRSLEKMAGRR